MGQQLGERATLLQFSSAFCAPCRATRRVLGEVTGLVDGVAHVEIDAEHHLEATRTLGILRTPTTIVLDAAGAEVTRATGAPTRDQVLTALARVVISGYGCMGHMVRQSGVAMAGAPRVVVMSSTMLTKRRAVDHCRVRSALCRMS